MPLALGISNDMKLCLPAASGETTGCRISLEKFKSGCELHYKTSEYIFYFSLHCATRVRSGLFFTDPLRQVL